MSKIGIEVSRVLRYASVGGVCAAIEFTVFSILVLYFRVYYISGNVLAFGVAFLIGFWLQKTWTFRNYERRYKTQITKFLIIVGIGFLLNNFFVYLFIGVLGFPVLISKPLQLFSVFFWNYSGQRFWTFKTVNA
jgi:putative flippase GtrA